jgi:penicillin-binding protein 2
MKTQKSFHSVMNRRAILLGGAQLGFIGLIGWRMRQLGVRQTDEFRLLAEENRVNIRLIPPVRGLIYDRKGNPLAQNNPIYTIELVREQAGDPEKVLRRLAQLIPLSDAEIAKTLLEMSRRRAFVPVTVKSGLEWEHIAAVSANAPSLPGVSPELGFFRTYPAGDEYSHIVGYVGRIFRRDLEASNNDPLLMVPRFRIGRTGIEKRLESNLRGSAGVKRIEVNSVGRVMRELDREEPVVGDNLQLTIDSDLQKFTLQRLEGLSASAVVMDVQNGDVLALASVPTFDPNKFVRGISQDEYSALQENPYRPLFDKSISGLYPPASTFKMVVALAALELGLVTPDEDVYCPGHLEVFDRKFHCWRRAGHGKVNLREALRQSCDVYFYDLSLRVGIEEISKMANKLGLGIKPVLPLPAVSAGRAPTKAWKNESKGKDWVIGDTVNASIGQGFVLASPLQLSVMTARLATGNAIEPRLVNLRGDQKLPVIGNESIGIDPAHLRIVQQGMFDVSNHPRGTAFRSQLKYDGSNMAGKTGTAQVRFITLEERKRGVVKNEDLPWERRDHALFVAYAPVKNPRYAISVVVEHGGGGSRYAAPIARDIMEKALSLGQSPYGPLPSQKRVDVDLPVQTPKDHA